MYSSAIYDYHVRGGMFMREKQLMIGVPTKNHPEYIQIYLARVLEDARFYGIDLHIYDSSEDNLTENIVKDRIKSGYDNLYYHRYNDDDITQPPVIKLKDILVDSGYEYVWPCGDGVMLNLNTIMPYIEKETNADRDLIIFNEIDRRHGYVEYTDPVKLIVERWKALSLYGGAIFKGDLFLAGEWDRLFSKYPDNIHLAGIFDIFAGRSLNAISMDTYFCIANPYKREATWITGGRLLQAVADRMPSEVNELPHLYDPVKKQVARSFAELRDMFLPPNIWWLRANDNISPKKTIEYRKQLREITDTKYILFLTGSFVPKGIARKIANIISYS